MCREGRLMLPQKGISEKERPREFHAVTIETARGLCLFTTTFAQEISHWIFGIADFSGVNILAHSVTSQAIRLFVCTPNIDKVKAYQAGEGICPISDAEFSRKLGALYRDPERGEKIVKRWHNYEKRGKPEKASCERHKFVKRMTNISQFVKSLKERLTIEFNKSSESDGTLWKGRFFSTFVDDKPKLILFNMISIACAEPLNPDDPLILPNSTSCREFSSSGTQWTSFGLGSGNFTTFTDEVLRAKCRKGIITGLSCTSWDTAQVQMEHLLKQVIVGNTSIAQVAQMAVRAQKRGRPIREVSYLTTNAPFTFVIATLTFPSAPQAEYSREEPLSAVYLAHTNLPIKLHNEVMGTDPKFLNLLEEIIGKKTYTQRIHRWIDYFKLLDWSFALEFATISS